MTSYQKNLWVGNLACVDVRLWSDEHRLTRESAPPPATLRNSVQNGTVTKFGECLWLSSDNGRIQSRRQEVISVWRLTSIRILCLCSFCDRDADLIWQCVFFRIRQTKKKRNDASADSETKNYVLKVMMAIIRGMFALELHVAVEGKQWKAS